LVDKYSKHLRKSAIAILNYPHITIGAIKYIEEEVNFLEEREAGLVNPINLIDFFKQDEWTAKRLPILINYLP
jgi:hypothetical protein